MDAAGKASRSEDEIRRSELRLKLLADALPLQICYVDKDQRYRFNNRAYEIWIGYSQEEIRGRHVRDVLGSKAYQVVLPHIENALAGNTVDFEAQVPYETGGMRYIHGTYLPDIGENGAIEGLFVVIEDITPRKQAELALEQAHSEFEERDQQRTAESERRLEDYAKISAVWFTELDANLRFTFISDTVSIVNRKPADFLGKTRKELAGDAFDPSVGVNDGELGLRITHGTSPNRVPGGGCSLSHPRIDLPISLYIKTRVDLI